LISRLRLGQQDVLAQIGRPRPDEKLLGIVDPRGALVALAQWSDDDVAVGRWRLVRIFKE
jgi:hypothetical protein